jgi:hypothetical protein
MDPVRHLGLCAALLVGASACGSGSPSADPCADGSCADETGGTTIQPGGSGGSGGGSGSSGGAGATTTKDGGAGAVTDAAPFTDAPTSSNPSGALPPGMPKHLAVGLFIQLGWHWGRDSGVPWDAEYGYYTSGWATHAPGNGGYALDYMKECDAQGMMPVIEYYVLNGMPGGGEDKTLVKVQDTATMATYFDDVRTLMQRAKDFGKPVLVQVEADGFGFLEIQAKDAPNTKAAIASTALAELAGLPDTVAGWGLAWLAMRKAVGATNVILAMHISGWSSGGDIPSYAGNNITQSVTTGYKFHGPLGLAANVTGDTYDLLVADPLDRDADFYKLTQSSDRWWDASDTALTTVPSFNRYAEWLRQWSVKAKKRWVLWQIPNGNSNSLNVDFTNQNRGGYKDNRPEYWFAPDPGGGYATAAAHRQKFVDVGVIALFFGFGNGQQSEFTQDTWTDGKLFLKTHAGEYLKSPLALPE